MGGIQGLKKGDMIVDINNIKAGKEYIFYNAFEDKRMMGEIKEIKPKTRRAVFFKVRGKDGSLIQGWDPERETSIPLFEIVKLITKE